MAKLMQTNRNLYNNLKSGSEGELVTLATPESDDVLWTSSVETLPGWILSV